MSCVAPLTAYRGRLGSIVFDARHSLSKVPMSLPCGRCIGCRLERARQWGVRCMHEKKMWKSSCFVTLTYSDEFLPEGGSLVLRDVQLFMKKLRKRRSASAENPIRFFAAGEYGELNRRPHYHLLLFNCDFPDKLFFTQRKTGPIFTSGELSEIWDLGLHEIDEVTIESAIYCAKYALKKLTPGRTQASLDRYNDRYQVYDENGIIYDRKPEFAVMSLKPGIGAGYYAKFGNEVRDHDNVIVNCREAKPPRYYDQLTERSDVDTLERLKRRRRRLAVLNRHDNTPERLCVKKRLLEIAAEKKERLL